MFVKKWSAWGLKNLKSKLLEFFVMLLICSRGPVVNSMDFWIGTVIGSRFESCWFELFLKYLFCFGPHADHFLTNTVEFILKSYICLPKYHFIGWTKEFCVKHSIFPLWCQKIFWLSEIFLRVRKIETSTNMNTLKIGESVSSSHLMSYGMIYYN